MRSFIDHAHHILTRMDNREKLYAVKQLLRVNASKSLTNNQDTLSYIHFFASFLPKTVPHASPSRTADGSREYNSHEANYYKNLRGVKLTKQSPNPRRLIEVKQ